MVCRGLCMISLAQGAKLIIHCYPELTVSNQLFVWGVSGRETTIVVFHSDAPHLYMEAPVLATVLDPACTRVLSNGYCFWLSVMQFFVCAMHHYSLCIFFAAKQESIYEVHVSMRVIRSQNYFWIEICYGRDFIVKVKLSAWPNIEVKHCDFWAFESRSLHEWITVMNFCLCIFTVIIITRYAVNLVLGPAAIF